MSLNFTSFYLEENHWWIQKVSWNRDIYSLGFCADTIFFWSEISLYPPFHIETCGTITILKDISPRHRESVTQLYSPHCWEVRESEVAIWAERPTDVPQWGWDICPHKKAEKEQFASSAVVCHCWYQCYRALAQCTLELWCVTHRVSYLSYQLMKLASCSHFLL